MTVSREEAIKQLEDKEAIIHGEIIQKGRLLARTELSKLFGDSVTAPQVTFAESHNNGINYFFQYDGFIFKLYDYVESDYGYQVQVLYVQCFYISFPFRRKKKYWQRVGTSSKLLQLVNDGYIE